MLLTEGLSVRLGGVPVLEGVGMTAQPGVLTAIVGPNGSGKTTLMRALTGEIGYRGRIALNGAEIRDLRPGELARIRGVLPQSGGLSFPFTVHEVVRLGQEAGAEPLRADGPGAALVRVGLGDYAHRLYQELSGGEQQRVQLARVLAQIGSPVSPEGRPRWLFLDEPVSSLDIGHQLLVMGLARDFAAAGGGVVAVMHDLNLTAMFAASVLLMRKGALAEQGPPERILRDDLLSATYGCRIRVGVAPADAVFLLPHSCAHGVGG